MKADLSGRQGHQEDYSIRDSAESLWKQENLNFNIYDPDSIGRIQERLRRDLSTMSTTEEESTAQRTNLEEVYQAGKVGMIDGCTQFLQSDLGISGSDDQAIRDDLSTLLDSRSTRTAMYSKMYMIPYLAPTAYG